MPSAHAHERLRTLPGFRLGHASDFRGLTGCTVVLCEEGAVCGVDVRGSAAGTRELEPCRPGHIVERVHAVLLTGGSAFGLDAAAGVMRYLESRGAGFPAGKIRVPIVPAAVIFDLGIGSAKARPDAAMALRACRHARQTVEEGSVGVGTGATVGKIQGMPCATKGGVGFGAVKLSGGVTVQALAVVNAFGDVLNPRTGSIVAGARGSDRSVEFIGTTAEMFRGKLRTGFGATNTALVVIMTNARLDKVQATKVAQMAHDGLARAISPVHTMFDGDVAFALSLGRKRADLNALGAAAAEATAQAIERAVEGARGLGGVPSVPDLMRWANTEPATRRPAGTKSA
jgi:L-aminopeptidase/D-esterase-like protein